MENKIALAGFGVILRHLLHCYFFLLCENFFMTLSSRDFIYCRANRPAKIEKTSKVLSGTGKQISDWEVYAGNDWQQY